MWLWLLLFVVMGAFCIFGIIYIAFHAPRFSFLQAKAREHKAVVRCISIAVLLLILVLLSLWLNVINAVIAYLHLLVFWLIADLIAFIIRKIKKQENFSKRYFAGAGAIAFTIVYLAIGAYMDFHVWEKDYVIETEKSVGDIRIAMIADSHLGTTFGGEGFAKHLEEIQKANPDVLVICGDYVDDDSTYEDMVEGCAALGEFKSTYGVYYSFGNHDKGYYNSREYTAEELIQELEKNHVTVLQDEAVLVDNRFYLIGRQDASEKMRGSGRAEISDIVKDLDASKYMIVLNHQPNDYASEAASGVDLVLSGHTHGGQLFPVNVILNIVKVDNRVYGTEMRGNTNFIVTSGISDWAIKYKTCTRSEFVVVDINGK